MTILTPTFPLPATRHHASNAPELQANLKAFHVIMKESHLPNNGRESEDNVETRLLDAEQHSAPTDSSAAEHSDAAMDQEVEGSPLSGAALVTAMDRRSGPWMTAETRSTENPPTSPATSAAKDVALTEVAKPSVAIGDAQMRTVDGSSRFQPTEPYARQSVMAKETAVSAAVHRLLSGHPPPPADQAEAGGDKLIRNLAALSATFNGSVDPTSSVGTETPSSSAKMALGSNPAPIEVDGTVSTKGLARTAGGSVPHPPVGAGLIPGEARQIEHSNGGRLAVSHTQTPTKLSASVQVTAPLNSQVAWIEPPVVQAEKMVASKLELAIPSRIAPFRSMPAPSPSAKNGAAFYEMPAIQFSGSPAVNSQANHHPDSELVVDMQMNRQAAETPLLSIATTASNGASVTAANSANAFIRPAIQSVSDAAVHLRTGQTEIALSPEELGRVTIRMTQTDMGLMVLLTVERDDTQALMRKHVSALADSLREAGLGEAQIDFSDNRNPSKSEIDRLPSHPSDGETSFEAQSTAERINNAGGTTDRLDIRM